MLNLIVGSVGCGKTTYVHQLLKKRAAAGEDGSLLLVPEQFTYESELGVLRLLGPADSCKLSILSFERLNEFVAEKLGDIRRPQPDACGRAVLMSLAIESVSDRLMVYSRHVGSTALVSNMLDIIDELKQCDVSYDTLRATASKMPDSILRNKSMEIACVYEAYEAMTASSCFDDTDPMERLARLLAESDLFDGKTIVIDGFRRFTARQLNVIGQLMKKASQMYVTLCADGTGGDPGDASVFYCTRMYARKLISMANRMNVAVANPVLLTDSQMGFSTYGSDGLRYLEKSVYDPLAEPFEEPCEALTICCAPSIEQECEWTAREIRSLMRSGEYRCRDIAVIYRTAGVYERELINALKKYGVPMFEDNRQPVVNQPLMMLVSSALSICSGGFVTDTVMRYVKTSLSGLGTDEWSVLENYVLMWGINGTAWLTDWSFNPDGFGVELDAARKERLDAINGYRRRVVQPLVALKAECENADGRGISAAVYHFLAGINAGNSLRELAVRLEDSGEQALAVEQQQVWDMLMQLLDQIAAAAGEYTFSLKKYSELFSLSVNSCTLGRIPTGFDETFIGTAPRIQTRVPRAVFVVGMNNGVFPLQPSSAGLFTDSERMTLEKYSLEMADNSRLRALDERFIVYNSLCSAREKLFVSYSCADVKGARLMKSEVIDMLERLFPKCVRVNASQVGDEQLIESNDSAFELLAARWRQGGDLVRGLRSYFSGLGDYSGRLAALGRAADKEQFSISDTAISKRLFGTDMKLSASRIEVYGNCPFEYFCKYGLYARPRQTASLDPAQSGTVIHYVLEKLLRTYGGKGLSKLSSDELNEQTESILAEYADEFMGGLADKDKRFTYNFSRLGQTVRVIVGRLAGEFASSLFEPCEFELEIGGNGPVDAYKVSLPDGGSISVYGYIDRVDVMESDGKKYIRVVDYKTGIKEFALSDVLNGLNMQMLIYLESLWSGGSGYFGAEVIPAGVLYLPARFVPFDVSRGLSDDMVQEKILGAGRMNGMILDDSKVIHGMDTSASGTFVPLKIDRNGAVKGSLIDLVQLGKLREKTDDILKQLALSLRQGEIPAKPVFGKNHDKTCEYCDYASVCCHEADDECRYINFLSHEQCLENLTGKEQDNGKTVDE